MNIFLVSNSARGEAIADALLRSPKKPSLVVASTVRSPGFVRMGCDVRVADILDQEAMVKIAKETQCTLAFVAPDDPIGAGLADALEAAGIPCVAPKKSLARIESSKGFARELMRKHGIDGSPAFRVFVNGSTDAEVREYIEKDLGSEYVVKYDALKGGKGVKVSGEHLANVEEGVAYAMECIAECGRVVIEEKLVGVEFSLLSFVSGDVVVDMPAVQDHKRSNEGDTGPNTGGMGTYSDADHSLPFLAKHELQAASEFNRRVAKALMDECDEPYKGILYGGFIATKRGVKVIEYNARFGDPEALNVLPLLRSDFVEICEAIAKGTLTKEMVIFEKKATVCKYIVPRSYPEAKNESGQEINIPDPLPEGVIAYFGDVTLEGEKVLLGGSRSIGIVGIGGALEEAEKSTQSVCESIQGPVRFRSDIGTKKVIEKRITMMEGLRHES